MSPRYSLPVQRSRAYVGGREITVIVEDRAGRGKCLGEKTWQVQSSDFEPDRDILLRVAEVSQ